MTYMGGKVGGLLNCCNGGKTVAEKNKCLKTLIKSLRS